MKDKQDIKQNRKLLLIKLRALQRRWNKLSHCQRSVQWLRSSKGSTWNSARFRCLDILTHGAHRMGWKNRVVGTSRNAPGAWCKKRKLMTSWIKIIWLFYKLLRTRTVTTSAAKLKSIVLFTLWKNMSRVINFCPYCNNMD